VQGTSAEFDQVVEPAYRVHAERIGEAGRDLLLDGVRRRAVPLAASSDALSAQTAAVKFAVG
jgi:hypothetical protein